MRHLAGRSAIGFIAGGALLCLVACRSAGSQRIVGPDGSPMAHVHCGSDQGLCFRMAGELCPSGYDLKPVLRESDGNFLVRCRARKASALANACPPAASASVVRSHPPGLMDPWPPTAEPASAADPWPSPHTSAATRQPKAPAAQADVDIGY